MPTYSLVAFTCTYEESVCLFCYFFLWVSSFYFDIANFMMPQAGFNA